MSPEAPKQTGVKPDGCLPGFLRRLVRQPTPPPAPGLETFASALQQKIDAHLVASRQQAIDQQRAQAVTQAARAEGQARELQRQKEIADQARTKTQETQKILQDFKVLERLRHIQKIVWKGAGTVRQLPDADVDHTSPSNLLSGFELLHQYPSYKVLEGDDWGSMSTSHKYEPDTGQTRLRVRVVEILQDSSQSKKVLRVSSSTYISDPRIRSFRGISPETIFEVDIPIEAQDRTALLDQALINEATLRIERGFLPQQLEKRAGEELAEAQRSPMWEEWGEGKVHYAN